MGNCCRPASSMEWDGEDWSSLKSSKNIDTAATTTTTRKSTTATRSSKVFDEAHHHGLCLGKVQKEKLLEGLRTSPDENGKVKLRISKKELAELLLLGGIIIENNNNNNNNNQQSHSHHSQMKKKKKQAASAAEQVLFRLINARDHAVIANKHILGPWKPVLETIPESPKVS